ncbi:MAG: hypothetical protein IJQ56_11890, partial [Synergistaceae bacterium]|nr:hypothetical protein [Synergistaceae bacterium]
ISEESHGNFIGLGMADITTKRTFEKLQTNATYFNMFTSTVLGVGKIPMVLEDDRMCIQAAIRTLNGVDKDKVRVIYLKNTLSLGTVMISEALLDEAKNTEGIEILEQPRPLRFDSDGNLLELI